MELAGPPRRELALSLSLSLFLSLSLSRVLSTAWQGEFKFDIMHGVGYYEGHPLLERTACVLCVVQGRPRFSILDICPRKRQQVQQVQEASVPVYRTVHRMPLHGGPAASGEVNLISLRCAHLKSQDYHIMAPTAVIVNDPRPLR